MMPGHLLLLPFPKCNLKLVSLKWITTCLYISCLTRSLFFLTEIVFDDSSEEIWLCEQPLWLFDEQRTVTVFFFLIRERWCLREVKIVSHLLYCMLGMMCVPIESRQTMRKAQIVGWCLQAAHVLFFSLLHGENGPYWQVPSWHPSASSFGTLFLETPINAFIMGVWICLLG